MQKQKKTQNIYISSKNSYNPHTKSIALFFIMDYTLKCEVQKKITSPPSLSSRPFSHGGLEFFLSKKNKEKKTEFVA